MQGVRFTTRCAFKLGLVALGVLALGLAGRQAAARAGLPGRTATPLPQAVFASPEAACRAALDAHIRSAAPGRHFQLGAVRRLDAWAYAYAQEVDAGGRPLGESFVALLAHQEPGRGWYALTPGTGAPGAYNALLERFPTDLLDASHKAFLRQPEVAALAGSYAGHRLPWPAGQLAYVTQRDGTHHDQQVDFDIEGLAGTGVVYATKPGTVVFVKQSSREGACNPAVYDRGNLVVVQHDSGEYSWYLHLAYGSVSVQVGQRVGYGSRLGLEGATGYACGTHLHYMVSSGHTPWTDPQDPHALPWATGITAVDFVESPWAGLEVGQTYRSMNSPDPAGAISSPDEGVTVSGSTVLLQAQAGGDGVTHARFVAHYGGAWHALGPDFTTSQLGYYWDMCAAGVPDGPVTIGLEACLADGTVVRLPAQRQFVKRHDCTEPPRLQVVRPLTIAPAAPAAGQPVSAEFTLRNAGRQTLVVPGLAVRARGSTAADWPAVGQITLRIYEDCDYRQALTLAEPGEYLAEPVYQDAAGAWHAIPDAGLSFSVVR
jgi:murein DD-endopeptidase MepM/ murein hydrolase activator NlpD